MAAQWQSADGFTISGVGNVIATALPASALTDYYVETDDAIIGNGGYFLFSLTDTGGEFSLGLSSASAPSGPPYDPEFEIELRFNAAGEFEVYKSGVLISGAPVPYAFDTTFGIYRNSPTEWEVFYDDVSIEVLTFMSPPGSLRLAAVAGDDTGGAIEIVIDGNSVSVSGGHGGGGGGCSAFILAIVGSLEPDANKGYARLVYDLGRGHTPSVLVGHSEGSQYWRYVFKALPDRISDTRFVVEDDEDGNTVKTWAVYLNDFFNRRMIDDAPFTVMDQRTGDDVCVKFEQSELNYRVISRDIYTTEIRIREYRNEQDE